MRAAAARLVAARIEAEQRRGAVLDAGLRQHQAGARRHALAVAVGARAPRLRRAVAVIERGAEGEARGQRRREDGVVEKEAQTPRALGQPPGLSRSRCPRHGWARGGSCAWAGAAARAAMATSPSRRPRLMPLVRQSAFRDGLATGGRPLTGWIHMDSRPGTGAGEVTDLGRARPCRGQNAAENIPHGATLRRLVAALAIGAAVIRRAGRLRQPARGVRAARHDRPRRRHRLPAKTGAYYFGDVRQRCVWLRAKDGRVTRFSAPDHRLLGVFRLEVDEARGALWLAMGALPQMEGFTRGAERRRRSRRTGPRDRRRCVESFSPRRTAPRTSLAISWSRATARSTRPTRRRRSCGSWRRAAARSTSSSRDRFKSLQGITPSADGRTLFVTDYPVGVLAIDLTSAAVRTLTAPAGTNVRGCDTLRARRTGH